MAGLDAASVYALAKQLGHSDAGAQAAVAIAYYESNFGNNPVNHGDPDIGSFGIYQFNGAGELAHFAGTHRMDKWTAAQYVQDHPVEAAAWALDPKDGYLGQALILAEQKGLRNPASIALFGQCPNLGGIDGDCGAAPIIYPGLGQRGDTHYPGNGFSVADAWALFFGNGDPFAGNTTVTPPPIAATPPLSTDPKTGKPIPGTGTTPGTGTAPGIPLPGGIVIPVPTLPKLPDIPTLVKNAIDYALGLLTGIDPKRLLAEGGVFGVFFKDLQKWGTDMRAFWYKYAAGNSARVILFVVGFMAILAALIGLAVESTEKAASNPVVQTAVKVAAVAA